MIGWFGHLGADVCDLVDERLDPERTSRALTHLRRCPPCAALVREHRRQRRMTSGLGAVEVPRSLEERLLALAATGAADRDDDEDRGEPRGGAPWVAPVPRRPRRLAVSAVAVVGVVVVGSGSLVVLGSGRTTPAAQLTAVSAVPVSTHSGAGAWPAGWQEPVGIAGEVEVVGTAVLPDGGVRVDLLLDGASVTVLEGHGQLSLDGATVSRSLRTGDVEAHLVDGWWVAQVGPDTVAVAAWDDELALAVLRGFEVGRLDVLGQLASGWQVIAGG